jgi:hypothetical protein
VPVDPEADFPNEVLHFWGYRALSASKNIGEVDFFAGFFCRSVA